MQDAAKDASAMVNDHWKINGKVAQWNGKMCERVIRVNGPALDIRQQGISLGSGTELFCFQTVIHTLSENNGFLLRAEGIATEYPVSIYKASLT